MRIVGGTWRGRSFEAPEGRGTRPTTDRMRESIASMILSACGLDLSDVAVLDAFAGSGGVGLELLSRGARSCTFCERNRRAAGIVRRNCKALCAADDTWRVVVADVCAVAERGPMVGGPFDVVFLDPPYAMPAADVTRLVEELAAQGSLAEGCLVVYERASDGPALELAGARLARTKKHGGTSIDLVRMGE